MDHRTYPFELLPLPYAYDALEPYIDAETMRFHHDRHLKTYVDNLNKALEGYPQYHSWTLEELLKNLSELPDGLRTAVRNNGGGVYNHELFFELMAPGEQAMLPQVSGAFGGEEAWKKGDEPGMKSVSKHELVKLLSICGQVAEHKSEKVQEHGRDEKEILSAISPEEQETLKGILQKLQKQWMQDHKEHHSRKE